MGRGRPVIRFVRPAVALVLLLAGIGVSGAEARPSDRQPPGVTHVDPPSPGPVAAAPNVNATWRGRAGEQNGALAAVVPCIGDGTSGKRIEVIYAHFNDGADRIGTFREPIRT